MTITHQDFFRLFSKAVNSTAFVKSGNNILIRLEDRYIEITLARESVRKVASLTLPVTNVTLEFKNFQQEEIQDFMARFDLAYQKGGG